MASPEQSLYAVVAGVSHAITSASKETLEALAEGIDKILKAQYQQNMELLAGKEAKLAGKDVQEHKGPRRGK